MIRLLLDPAPADGGGAVPPTPATTPPAPAPTPTIAVTPDQFQAYLAAQNELNEIKARQAQEKAQAEAEKQKVLLEKGQAEAALQALKGQYEPQIATLSEQAQKYRQRLAGETLAKAVAEAFAGVQFVSDDARRQALAIAAAELEATEGPDGSFAPRQKATGIPAADYLKSQIASPAFAHFLKPSAQGGSGATNTPPPGGPPPPQEAPKNLGQLALLAERAATDVPRWLQRN